MKRIFVIIIVVTFLFSCPAYAIGDTPGTRDLNINDIGFDVIAIQDKLIELGYLGGVAGGVFDEKTANAVVAFELENGLSVRHGFIDIATQNAIMDANSSTSENSFDEDDYKEIMRDPVSTWRNAYVIHGTVIGLKEEPVKGFDKTHVTLLIATKDGYDNPILAEYTRYDEETRILKKDVVTAYGEAHGTKKYKTSSGIKNEVPFFLIEEISLDE